MTSLAFVDITASDADFPSSAQHYGTSLWRDSPFRAPSRTVIEGPWIPKVDDWVRIIACANQPQLVGCPARLTLHKNRELWEAMMAYDAYELILLHPLDFVQWNFKPCLKYEYTWHHWDREAILRLWEDGSVSFQMNDRNGELTAPCFRHGTWLRNAKQLLVTFHQKAWTCNAVHHRFTLLNGTKDCWKLAGCASPGQWCVLTPISAAESID